MPPAAIPETVAAELDQRLASSAPADTIQFIAEHFLQSGEYGLLFEARLMQKRLELGLPLVQTESVALPTYQDAVVEVARETGRLFLAAGNIDRAWPYYRAVGDPGPVEQALDTLDPEAASEGAISIAFQEGVHPRKGLELILEKHGMCRAITAFGMTAVQKDREACIGMLARHIHAEILSRMAYAIEAREGSVAETTSIRGRMEGRDWLFGDWDCYVDTSHLLSVVPYCVEITDPAVLAVFAELCAYGQRLAAQFQSPGIPPFTDQFTAYGHYVEALRGNDVEAHLDYFREQVAQSDPEIDGDAPGRTLARLFLSLNRPADALQTVLDHVFEDAPYGVPVPGAIQLCHAARDFDRMRELARERGDLLSYAAAGILRGSQSSPSLS
jgi:hypothetical protein